MQGGPPCIALIGQKAGWQEVHAAVIAVLEGTKDDCTIDEP